MKVGVIGAGTMGSGIAQVASTANCQVYLYDSQVAALDKSQQKLAQIMERLVMKGRLTEEKAQQIQQNIYYVQDLNELASSDLVIEAIIENPEIKKQVFSQLEPLLSAEAIIASNTSSLSIASLAAVCQRPERFVGIHFFNPAPLMKLVEIIPAVQTSTIVLGRANDIIASWGKHTVIAKDTPGFIVNRVARPFYGEALRIYDEGIADIPTIDWAMKQIGQFRMGPFELMDFIGNDVNYTVTETVFKAFYFDPRYRPSFTQKRMSEAGYLGRKSGRGYYDYKAGASHPAPKADNKLGQAIVDRIVVMLINEAADALHFKVASREDIDAAMTKGVNYPKGLLSWADEIGIENCVERLDQLFDYYRESRYRCSPLLRKMAEAGSRFFPTEKATPHF
ncbi:MAG: 3-hydroxybutyryl-CoA dehydrogenase [Saprospiraceae bacterium]|nr:3-hydroxybutyryl-CoA dehydrogenase [Saprospiraceae bacterium]